jgi:hypothetical protein
MTWSFFWPIRKPSKEHFGFSSTSKESESAQVEMVTTVDGEPPALSVSYASSVPYPSHWQIPQESDKVRTKNRPQSSGAYKKAATPRSHSQRPHSANAASRRHSDSGNGRRHPQRPKSSNANCRGGGGRANPSSSLRTRYIMHTCREDGRSSNEDDQRSHFFFSFKTRLSKFAASVQRAQRFSAGMRSS